MLTFLGSEILVCRLRKFNLVYILKICSLILGNFLKGKKEIFCFWLCLLCARATINILFVSSDCILKYVLPTTCVATVAMFVVVSNTTVLRLTVEELETLGERV
jgi:hypothetical protein